MDEKNTCRGIFCIALATLVWEILLARIFSATMYYHFVFISISLAMLGFGCGGAVVYILRKKFTKEQSSNHMAISSLLFSITAVFAIAVYLQLVFPPNPSVKTFLKLGTVFALIFIPYFCSGLAITLALKHYAKKISILYCYDLLGAGVGCGLVILMLFVFDGISMVVFAASVGALASVFLSRFSKSAFLRRACIVLTVLLFAGFLGNAYVWRVLKVKYVAGADQADIIYEKWNPINRVTVKKERSELYKRNETLTINYDSSALSPIHYFDGNPESVDYLQDLTTSFYYKLKKNADVLIIGAGGGHDALTAYINGQKTITCVEINPAIADLGKRVFRDVNGDLFNLPGVSMVIDDGRNYVRQTQDVYDIIELSNVDSFIAASSGAFTFVENSLYTVEAFNDYFIRLKPHGVLWFNRWRVLPDYSLETFKVFTTALAMLGIQGIKKPAEHIVILEEPYKGNWTQVVFLLKKAPFTAEELAAIDSLRAEMDLVWFFHPYETLDNEFYQYLAATDKAAYLGQYTFKVKPDTDNSPFFYNFLKPTHYLGNLPDVKVPFTYPVFMFKSLFFLVFGMVLVLICLPMVFYKKEQQVASGSSYTWGYIIYFSCLGLGFMLAEIPLIQKFILFLGQPLYAISVILSTLLISSGLGSLFGGRFQEEQVLQRLRLVLLVLVVVLVAYIFILPSMFNAFLGKPVAIRIFVSMASIFPLGFLMGMGLPLGIRVIEAHNSPLIPWMWGINGACSVMGSVIAWGLSLNFGYNNTMLFAAAVYFLAFVVMMLRKSSKQALPL